MLKGIAASSGIGIGRAVILNQNEIKVVRRTVHDPKAELHRFADAVDVFCAQITEAGVLATQNFGKNEAGIITYQNLIVKDIALQDEVTTRVEKNSENAEYAFAQVIDRYIEQFALLDDELMKSRVVDLRDIKNHLLGILTGNDLLDIGELPFGCVLVAEDISPSLIALIRPGQVSAIAISAGTVCSHVAILARSVQIPAVVAVRGLLKKAKDGDTLIVDGSVGEVILNPSAEDTRRYERRKSMHIKAHQRLETYKNQSTITRDGKRMELAANLAVLRELPDILDSGADGIGLFRTEYLYMDNNALPDEQQQFLTYKAIAQGMKGKPVNIRTLDSGGERAIPYLEFAKESNPSMGLRAVRYSLAYEDMFKVQLTALLRASAFGDVNILVPMITTVEELRRVRALLEECKGSLVRNGIEFDKNIRLGVMIETPAASMIASVLAQEADFFSLGTNDITQYTLAVDRNNRSLSHLYNSFHPAVLKLIYQAIQAAHVASIPVGICGEAATDPLMLPFLVGCGITQLSVRTTSLLSIREQIGNLSHLYWNQQLHKIMSLATADDVLAYIRQNWSERPEQPPAMAMDDFRYHSAEYDPFPVY